MRKLLEGPRINISAKFDIDEPEKDFKSAEKMLNLHRVSSNQRKC